MNSIMTLLEIVLAVAGLAVAHRLLNRKRLTAPYPPGPPGLPLLGNVLDMPNHHEWYKFAEWGQQYGDITYLNLLGQPVVILNSPKAAMEMLDAKSSLYSDRPVLMMGGELIGWKYTLALTPYGDRFREYRRYIARIIGGKPQVDKHRELTHFETHKFLRRMLQNPEEVAAHIRKTAGAIILKLSHGYDVKEGPDPVVDLVDAATEQFALSTSPGAYLVDVFPALQYVPAWFPGAQFRRTAKLWRKTLMDMADIPHEFVKTRMLNDTNVPNFTSELLEHEEVDADKEFNIKWSAASLYSGGADTTVSAIYSFFLAMTLFPDIQSRAQAEIDAVVGYDRLPTSADRSSLPYIDAIVKEVFRWNPVAPTGVPHRVLEDDIHKGYLIPKGSIIIANIWQMLHDPEYYPEPLAFNPSRYLPDEKSAPAPDPRNYCFGFGRRICPGLFLADTSVFLSCAMTLAVFNVTKAVEDGKIIEPEVEYTSGVISHPKPFKCSIKPRTAKAEALIQSIDDE